MEESELNLSAESGKPGQRAAGSNYKYQRLRERLRAAISSGELSGKLPGERILAQRFGANAKTLSKALTDLAVEGLLERSVGRGTFVKGAKPALPQGDRWLILCEPALADGPVARALIELHPNAQLGSDVGQLRPSFINRFSATLVLSQQVPESILRDLTIRNMPLLLVNREPVTFSVRAVVFDAALAAARLARQLLLGGHRRLLVVEAPGSTALLDTVRQAARKFTADITVDALEPDQLALFPTLNCTALLCASIELAERAIQIQRAQAPQGAIQITAIGISARPPCTGCFADPRDIARACADYLKDVGTASFSTSRPSTLWLAPSWHEQDEPQSCVGDQSVKDARPRDRGSIVGLGD